MIELPIKVGQKFLSNGIPGTIISVNLDNDAYQVAWLSDDGKHVMFFTNDGMFFSHKEDVRDLQPIPVKITEGVEFSGEQYRQRFNELIAEGREFEFLQSGLWNKKDNRFFHELITYRLLPQKITIPEGEPFIITSDAMRRECLRLQDKEGREFICDNGSKSPDLIFGNNTASYTLLPQHRDAVGNPLKVGDRVAVNAGNSCFKDKITKIANGRVYFDLLGTVDPSDCRKLTTRTRPLCADDLMKHRTALFDHKEHGLTISPIGSFTENCVTLEGLNFSYRELQEHWQWSPSADQPWQPCEVTEEVPV